MKASPESSASFLNATNISMSDLTLLIAGIVATAIFLWSAWVTLSHYEQWAQGKNGITLFDVMWCATRSIILLSLILFIVN